MIKSLSYLSLTSALVLGLVGCSASHTATPANTVANSTSIIGGDAVDASDSIAKTTVAIITSVLTKDGQSAQFECTGTLIAPHVVMTAAHCVPNSDEYARFATAIIFNSKLTGNIKPDVRRVVDYKVHPDYGDGDRRLQETIDRLKKAGNPTGEGVTLSDADQGADNNDIALMKFDGEPSAGYGYAKILTDDSLLKAGTTVTLAGYGVTSVTKKAIDPKKYPQLDQAIASGQVSCSPDRSECYVIRHNNENILKKTQVNVIQAFGNTEIVVDQSQGKGACHGDSGGPAFLTVNNVQYVWGVTSRGSGKNGIDDCSEMSIYTKANSHQDFIKKSLKEWAL